jgi:DEAD/DEAH box helicase domain-containing protein
VFGRENVQQILGVLAEEGFVHLADGQWNWTQESYPADAVSLRSVSSDNFVVVDVTGEPRIVGETDYTSAPSTLHEKAIYIVEGKLYQVERLDFDGRKAYVREVDCDYYTDAITYTKVTILDTFASGPYVPIDEEDAAPIDVVAAAAGADDVEPGAASRPLPGRRGEGASVGGPGAGTSMARRDADGGAVVPIEPAWAHGEVHVASRVVGFKKIKFYTNENVGSGELDLPEQQMHTTSYWLTIPSAVMSALPFGSDDRRDGVSGLAYAMRNVAQLLLMCDRQDIGLSVDAGEPEAGVPAQVTGGAPSEPRVFIYDNYPGGIGFSEPLFQLHDTLLTDTRELIRSCPCESGCPSCVGPVGEVGPAAKAVAQALLGRLTGERVQVSPGVACDE